jgi:hypothetical protein
VDDTFGEGKDLLSVGDTLGVGDTLSVCDILGVGNTLGDAETFDEDDDDLLDSEVLDDKFADLLGVFSFIFILSFAGVLDFTFAGFDDLVDARDDDEDCDDDNDDVLLDAAADDEDPLVGLEDLDTVFLVAGEEEEAEDGRGLRRGEEEGERTLSLCFLSTLGSKLAIPAKLSNNLAPSCFSSSSSLSISFLVRPVSSLARLLLLPLRWCRADAGMAPSTSSTSQSDG